MVRMSPPPHIFAKGPGQNPKGDKKGIFGNSRFPFILKYAYFQGFIISEKRSVSATFNLAVMKIIFADVKFISAVVKFIPAMVKIIPAIANTKNVKTNEAFAIANRITAIAKAVSATMFQGIALMCEPSANASGISAIAIMLPVTISCCNIAAETTPALISYCNIAAGIKTARAGVASALAAH